MVFQTGTNRLERFHPGATQGQEQPCQRVEISGQLFDGRTDLPTDLAAPGASPH